MRTVAWMVLAGGYAIALAVASPLAAAPGEVDPAVLQAEAQRVAVIAKVAPAVLAIFSPTGAGGGSGVVISPDGYALTNFHVAQPCGKALKCGMPDGKVYDAVIVGIDPVGDVALVKLFGRDDFPCAELGDSDTVAQGDPCMVMGNPFLLALDFQPTVTCGIISGVHRYQYPAGTILEYADCLQTDASINPGNSGGPLFDQQGRVIGINGRASFEKRGRVNVGVGYAISINQIKNFLGHLRSGRIVDHATLGARVATEDGRAVVADVLEDCDAYRRGLRYGDEIVRFGGRLIHSANAFQNALGIFPKGWRVPLTYRREGKQYDVLVRLGGVHSEADLIRKATGRPPSPPMPIPKPGQPPEPKPGPKPSGKAPRPGDGQEEPLPPGHPALRPPPMPEVVKKHYEERPGYANYYFNRTNRQRVWDAWMARTGFSQAPAVWVLEGPLTENRRYRLELSDDEALLSLAGGQTRWLATEEIPASLLPEGSGGMLPALYLWRRLAVAGPDKFGDVYYLGTAPWSGRPELADVLVGVHAGAECHFYFDAKERVLLGLELYPAPNSDPCELHFRDYHEVEGRWIPQRIEVRYGEILFAELKIDRFLQEKLAKHGSSP